MITPVKYPISLVAVCLWMGFVCAISFMEAWLKFRAPGITVSLGLGIGRLVFAALNKVEWVLCVVIMVQLFWSKGSLANLQTLFLAIALTLLILQTLWLLPALDARAELHIQGLSPAPSKHHFYYVGLEVLKLLSLAGFASKLYQG